jgi:hypothetical protein
MDQKQDHIMMHPILIAISLTWIIKQAQELFSVIKSLPASNRVRGGLLHLVSCGKCLAFWIALGISLDLITAGLASISMAVISTYLFFSK